MLKERTGEEILKATGIYNWIVMDRIEDHLPSRNLQAEMIRCNQGRSMEWSAVPCFRGHQTKISNYTLCVTHCGHTLPLICQDEDSAGCFQWSWRAAVTEIPSGQENTCYIQTQSLLAFHNISQGLKSNLRICTPISLCTQRMAKRAWCALKFMS